MDPSISVVVSTFQRRDDCAVAVRSVLEQSLAPLEVLVCDDGSTDETPRFFRDWAEREPRLRYLRLERNAGMPAPARNLGLAEARGDWVAFLDDDDRWLPGKLELQCRHLSSTGVDVVAGNAELSSGGVYFPPADPLRLAGRDLLRDNPIVLSTAIARRDAVLAVGGFRTDPKLAGIEDYALWIDLAESGSSFLVLAELVAVYCDEGESRLSASAARRQRALAGHLASRWRCRPTDRPLTAAVTRQSVRLVKILVRRRLPRRLAPPSR